MNTIAMSIDMVGGAVALCAHCCRQRQAAAVLGGPELEALGVVSGEAFVPLVVVSGTCHDCGAGYCLCRGQLACERCPRKNARVIVQSLAIYKLAVPPPPSTLTGPLE